MTTEQVIEMANRNYKKRKAMYQRHTSHGHDLELIGNALKKNLEVANAFALARESQRHHI